VGFLPIGFRDRREKGGREAAGRRDGGKERDSDKENGGGKVVRGKGRTRGVEKCIQR